MAIALVWLSGREPMVIALVRLSAGNAICVMGSNFLETDQSLQAWLAGFLVLVSQIQDLHPLVEHFWHHHSGFPPSNNLVKPMVVGGPGLWNAMGLPYWSTPPWWASSSWLPSTWPMVA